MVTEPAEAHLPPAPPDVPPRPERRRGLFHALVVLARPRQWVKSGFVLLGPLYGLRDLSMPWQRALGLGLIAAAAFALASSATYVFNDLRDVEADRTHPRKRRRPIAAGEVSPSQAWIYMLVLGLGATVLGLWVGSWPVLILLALYVVNVTAYSLRLKHIVIADVMSLSLGFVLRMLAGCAAIGIGPTTWLLNVTLFLSMFLSFGKRLGERRTMGADAAAARGVQAAYTDELLRMAVVVTAVATLVTYAGYVQSRELAVRHVLWQPAGEFNLLWLTTLPATYALLRAIVLLERGRYDDPTELFARDFPMQLAALGFAGLTVMALAWH